MSFTTDAPLYEITVHIQQICSTFKFTEWKNVNIVKLIFYIPVVWEKDFFFFFKCISKISNIVKLILFSRSIWLHSTSHWTHHDVYTVMILLMWCVSWCHYGYVQHHIMTIYGYTQHHITFTYNTTSWLHMVLPNITSCLHKVISNNTS